MLRKYFQRFKGVQPAKGLRALRLGFESLEDRRLLTVDVAGDLMKPLYVARPAVSPLEAQLNPAAANSIPYSPAQIRRAYGLEGFTFSGGSVVGDGAGMTIAIVDAFDNPNIANDLHQFNLAFGLPEPPSFKKVNQTGGTTLPVANSEWAGEIALDVEWAHAIAPKANILLVEARDNFDTNLYAAVDYARSVAGVVVVSMSFGGPESAGDVFTNSHFVTPPGHEGVAFFASSGDDGAPAGSPSSSPNVVSTGGTSLQLDPNGFILSETGWSGSGGGISSVQAMPSYQVGTVTQTSTNRATPDVSFNSDPYTGFYVYDSYNGGSTPWWQFGGTSAAAPQWAAMVAIADQGRTLAGLSSFTSDQLLSTLYKMPANNFRDIVGGFSTGTPQLNAGPGYDLVTGRGSPIGNLMINSLVGADVNPASHFSVSAPSTVAADGTFTITVSALSAANTAAKGYTGTVHFGTTDAAAGIALPSDYAFLESEQGVHTFSGLKLDTAGAQQVIVTDTQKSTITGLATIIVNPAVAAKLVISAPIAVNAGALYSVTVKAVDAFGNTAKTYRGAVHFTTSDSKTGFKVPADYTFTAATNGVHTFAGLALATAGTCTVTVNDKANSALTATAAVNVNPLVATHFTLTAPTAASTNLPFAVTVTALDRFNNVARAYVGTVHFTSSDTKAILPADYVFVAGDNGVRVFNDLKLNTAGSRTVTAADKRNTTIKGVATLSVVSSAATRYLVSGPSNSSAGDLFDVTISAVNAANNPDVNYAGTVHFTSSDLGLGVIVSPDYTFTPADAGVHTFTGLRLVTAGKQTVTAKDKAVATITASLTDTVAAAAADHLVFAKQPAATGTGALMSAVTVRLLDAYGNLRSSDNSSQITLSFGENPGSATLSGTLTKTVSGGVATFSDLSIDRPGTGYTLVADDAGALSPITSSSFDVKLVPGAATHFAFTAPSDAAAALGFNVTLTALDALNNVATGYRGAIHFTTSDVGAGIVLPPDYTFTAADSGAHTFTGLKLSTVGLRTVTATDKANGAINASASINVSPASATQFLVSAPANSTAGSALSVTVTARDGGNNVAANYLGTVQFTTSDPGAGIVLPTEYTFTAADAGIHTFTDLTLVTAGAQTVTVKDKNIVAITGQGSTTVGAATADHLAFLQQPAGGSINVAIKPAVTVRVLDAFNNLLTGDTADQITLSLSGGPSGALLGALTTSTVVGGVAKFNNLSIDQIGTGYSLVATSGAMTTTSTSFDINDVPLLTNVVIEGFESGNLNAYTTVGSSRTASLVAGAKHDGATGLQDANGTDWIYRNDAAVQVSQGDTVSVWLNFSGTADGRAYFGFGASAAGTLSLIAAANTKQLMLDVNNAYGFTDIATAPFTFAANKWYKLEVNWGATGAIVGKLYDSDGTTLLQQVTGTNTTITSGGLAFRATTSNKLWDTVTLSQSANPGAVASSVNPALAAAATATAASKPLASAISPSRVQRMPSSISTLARSTQPSVPSLISPRPLSRTVSFYELGQSIASRRNGLALAKASSVTDWTIDPATLDAVADGKLSAGVQA